MGYILVYLSIRIFKGKTTEIIETVSESTDYSNIQPVYPFDNTKFIMGYTYAIDAIDYNCVQENIISQLYQYKVSKDENGLNPNRKYEYYDFEKCNNTHFSDKDFENFPYLNYLDWISSNFSVSGSHLANTFSTFGVHIRHKYNSSCPLTYEELIDKIYRLEINLVIANEYFDPSNREDPIKKVNTDQFHSLSTPQTSNLYNVFVKKNTYEIESGLFSPQKTGNFYQISKDVTHTSKNNIESQDTLLANLQVQLDPQVTHYKSTTYGIIDAIGTLGGTFEILFWLLMLLYSSTRDNVYLFSVINSLIKINQDENDKWEADENKNKILNRTNRHEFLQSINKVIESRIQVKNCSGNMRSTWEISPILLKHQDITRSIKVQNDARSLSKNSYPYSVLIKSWIPFLNRCTWDEEFSNYK